MGRLRDPSIRTAAGVARGLRADGRDRLGFALPRSFWPLFVVAVVGTLNPSAGDVSLFLPLEQAALAETARPRDLTAMFALYNVAGAFAGAFGALASGLPALLAARYGWTLAPAQRSGFFAYSILGLIAAAFYRSLSPAVEAERQPPKRAPLAKSRAMVLRLAALFSLDSFGGGFAIQSLLALWLFRRFHLSMQTAGAFFFVAGLLGSFSQFISPWLAARFGRINTMVYTHLPANVFLILAALMPTPPLAIVFLLLRAAMSSMDVPARQSYVMAVVPPEERAAAASVTNVPRSLASAGADPGGRDADAFVLRLAADMRRRAQGALRRLAADPVPRRPPVRRILIAFFGENSPGRIRSDNLYLPALPLSLLGRGSKVRVLIQRAFFARDSRFRRCSESARRLCKALSHKARSGSESCRATRAALPCRRESRGGPGRSASRRR